MVRKFFNVSLKEEDGVSSQQRIKTVILSVQGSQIYFQELSGQLSAFILFFYALIVLYVNKFTFFSDF